VEKKREKKPHQTRLRGGGKKKKKKGVFRKDPRGDWGGDFWTQRRNVPLKMISGEILKTTLCSRIVRGEKNTTPGQTG